jgi:hypothetical protein
VEGGGGVPVGGRESAGSGQAAGGRTCDCDWKHPMRLKIHTALQP